MMPFRRAEVVVSQSSTGNGRSRVELGSDKRFLRIILDSVADGVFTVGRDWRVTSFNRAAERITVAALKRAGLDPEKDVKIINLGIREQGPLVLGKTEASVWGNIDALSGFDPTPAIFEAKGLIKVLDIGKVCSLVLMNENFINNTDILCML